MKLEEGMFVRDKDGTIAKIERIINNEIHFDIKPIFSDGECLGYNWFNIYMKNVVKASHNITDLIEERDFVKVRIDGIFINWFMVDLFEDEEGNEMLGIGCYEDGLLNSISEYRPLNTLEVLEVVTKEQMESMSYRVGSGE